MREVQAVTANLIAAMRFFGYARPGGEVAELPAVTVVSCGLNYAAFNAALLSTALAGDGASFEDTIRVPAERFSARKCRWSYWLCDDFVSAPLRKQARTSFSRFGLLPLTEAPGMFSEAIAPPSRTLPELRVRRVDDRITRQAFAHITSTVFDIPSPVAREIYGDAAAWDGDYHGYIGYADGTEVCTGAVVTAAGVIGVYSVGTLPRWRHRGYGEAMVREIVSRARESTGITASVLQTTRMGAGLYERLGYRPVTNFQVFMA